MILTAAPELLVFGVMLVVSILTGINLMSRVKLLGIVIMPLCIALGIAVYTDHPLTPEVNLVALGFVALGLFNGWYAVFGRD